MHRQTYLNSKLKIKERRRIGLKSFPEKFLREQREKKPAKSETGWMSWGKTAISTIKYVFRLHKDEKKIYIEKYRHPKIYFRIDFYCWNRHLSFEFNWTSDNWLWIWWNRRTIPVVPFSHLLAKNDYLDLANENRIDGQAETAAILQILPMFCLYFNPSFVWRQNFLALVFIQFPTS